MLFCIAQYYGIPVACKWLWAKMRNGNCGTTMIGPQVRPCDRRYSAVYSGKLRNADVESSVMLGCFYSEFHSLMPVW